MERFRDSQNSNKKILKIYDESGNVVETQNVEIFHDSAAIPGTPLNAEVFNQMLDRINMPAPVFVKRYNNTSTGQSGLVQTFVAPKTGIYHIKAAGAQGGKGAGADIYSLVGGKGALIEADFQLNQGDVINIVVGQKGGDSQYLSDEGVDRTSGGGGGGTFVFREIDSANSSLNYNFTKDGQAYEVLLIAAGGGGTSDASYSNGTKVSGQDGDGTEIRTPQNNSEPGTIVFSGTDSASKAEGGSINQFVTYNAIGNKYTRTETVYGGYGGGAVGDDTSCSGGGWNFVGAKAFSWSLVENSIGQTGGNLYDHGYCIISSDFVDFNDAVTLNGENVKLALTLNGTILEITTVDR